MLEEGEHERHPLNPLALGPDAGEAALVLDVVEGVPDRPVHLRFDGPPQLGRSQNPGEAHTLGCREAQIIPVLPSLGPGVPDEILIRVIGVHPFAEAG